MVQRHLLELKCDTCKEITHVDITDSSEYNAQWPYGWCVVSVKLIGVEEYDEKVYCPEHVDPLAKVLGYHSAATMRAALAAVADAKANEAEKQHFRQLRREHGDIIESEDSIILITDDDDIPED